LTTTTTRPRLTLFGERPARNDLVHGIDAGSTPPGMRKANDDAIAAIRASFSEKKFKARRRVHIVS
jgi:hypothetical protein